MDQLGYNEKHSLVSNNIFLPSKAEVITYLLISTLLLFIASARTAWDIIVNNQSQEYIGMYSALQNQIDSVEYALSWPLLGIVSTMLFWGVVGCFAFYLIWVFQHFYLRIKKDVHDDNINQLVQRKSSWSVIQKHLLFFSTTILTIVSVVLFFSTILPFASNAVINTVGAPTVFGNYLQIALGIVIAAVGIYFIKTLYKSARYEWRVYFADTENN